MELERIEVRNYRSIFEEDTTTAGLRLDLGAGLNVMVGRNNCGKSNLFRALSAALDPSYEFDATRDTPGPKPHRYPSIQLWFRCDPSVAEEADLLETVRKYEVTATDGGTTRAESNEVVFRVSYAPTEGGEVERRERLVLLDGSDEAVPGKRKAAAAFLSEAIEQLRSLVRFVMVSSGESIESVLEGNFREILHSVVQEHMAAEFSAAEGHRQEYINGLQAELLEPLREIVGEAVQRLFPEIRDISFAPDVSDIESTLARVQIGLHDAVETPLGQKGTGVRGGVLVAMLKYLAENTSRCVVMAVEEPEAFLHPGAQEALREDLEALALRSDVTVLVTTHSPFIVSREPGAKSVLLEKGPHGRTRVGAVSEGADGRVAVISGIVRQESLEEALSAGMAIGPDKAGVLLVEGYGDKHYIEMAARKLGRPGLVSDIEIIPSNGCTRMANLAALTRASTAVPVGVLVDDDEAGKAASNRIARLESHETKTRLFSKKAIFSYGSQFKQTNFPWEAEDLFPADLVQEFVDSIGGPYAAKGTVERPDGGFHFDLGEEHKTQLGQFFEDRLQPEHLTLWQNLLIGIRSKLGLPDEAEPSDTPTSEPPTEAKRPTAEPPQKETQSAPNEKASPGEKGGPDERVMVVSQSYAQAEYLRSFVFVGDPGRGLSPDIRYVAFYENGEIREHVPRVLARHDDLVFDEQLASQLAKGSESDQALAAFMTEELESGRRAPGDTRQVFLLSKPDQPETIVLPAPIKNTKLSPKGKPMAWVVRHKMTWRNALLGGATNTSELDVYEEEKAK